MSILGGLGFGATMDLDNDGIPDCRDSDDDNDGINDTEDDSYVGNCSKPKRKMREPRDLDSDGIADCEDPDDDGDGINDTLDEYPHDHDNDGLPDHRDDDDDNDEIPDDEDDEYVGNFSKRFHRFGFRKPHSKDKDGPSSMIRKKGRFCDLSFGMM